MLSPALLELPGPCRLKESFKPRACGSSGGSSGNGQSCMFKSLYARLSCQPVPAAAQPVPHAADTAWPSVPRLDWAAFAGMPLPLQVLLSLQVLQVLQLPSLSPWPLSLSPPLLASHPLPLPPSPPPPLSLSPPLLSSSPPPPTVSATPKPLHSQQPSSPPLLHPPASTPDADKQCRPGGCCQPQ
ncbi:unnamed protein product [Closterium sp. NIES-54]